MRKEPPPVEGKLCETCGGAKKSRLPQETALLLGTYQLTRTSHFSVWPSTSAIIVVLPELTAVTSPSLLMVAMLLLSVLHFTVESVPSTVMGTAGAPTLIENCSSAVPSLW